MIDVTPILHIGGSGQSSIWLLGVTAGFVLVVGLGRLVGTRG